MQEFKAISGQGEVQCLMQWALRQALAFWESSMTQPQIVLT